MLMTEEKDAMMSYSELGQKSKSQILQENFVEIAKDEDIVNVVPQPKAGGSFATAAYKGLKNPVAVEFIKADAGLDIGGTLIGMHLKRVAVPLRIETKHIGNAIVLAARE